MDGPSDDWGQNEGLEKFGRRGNRNLGLQELRDLRVLCIAFSLKNRYPTAKEGYRC